MELTLKELVNAKEGLEKILKHDLPVKISYALSRKIKKVEDELKLFEEKRQGLFKKYGQQEGNQLKIKDENLEVFTKELSELFEVRITLEFEPIKISDIDGIKLSSLDMLNLERFLINDLEDCNQCQI